MSQEIAYALITPYSLYKSRTGGIISRLLANSRVEFVAARMYVLSDEFVNDYMKVFAVPDMEPQIEEAWLDYVDNNLRPNNIYGMVPRCMLMLFKGENAVEHLKEEVIGSLSERIEGETVRGTYGDFLRDRAGKVHYIEPAVLTGSSVERTKKHLELFAKYALTDGGLQEGKVQYGEGQVESTLVMLKPDNFEKPSRRPGNIIDTFSRTGLRIVGCRLFNMTVAMGEEFYGPLKTIFINKLKFLVAKEAKKRLEGAFDFPFSDENAEKVGDLLAEQNANCEFSKIVEYMTGMDPATVAEADKSTASNAKCLGLLYEGVDAIEKVRTVLGATNPSKAEPGTVRSDFGRDLMRNGAHASDSPASAVRERKIIGLATESDADTCDVIQIINKYLEQ